MSDPRHPAPEELADAERWAPDHPVRRHLETCPRCQAQVLAYRRFVADPTDLPAADRAAARERLQVALAAEIGGARVVTAAGRPARDVRTRSHGWRLSPVYAFAAGVLIVGAIVVAVVPMPWRAPEELMRQTGPGAGVEAVPPLIRGGHLVFRWRALPAADQYRVTLYAADLRPIDPPTVTSDTLLTIPLASLRGRFEPKSWLYWQIVALQGGDEIADSGPRSFRSP